jgi:hypothetical protein
MTTRALSAAARKFHVALIGGASTVGVAWLATGDWKPAAITAIPAAVTAFGVYWAPNE